MEQLIVWFGENKEWLFDGIGVAVITSIVIPVVVLIWKKIKKQKTSEESVAGHISIKQVNHAKKSTQIGVQNNYYSGGKEDE